MQLLFSFDQGMKVEKTLMQTLASQLSCNSCSRLTGAWELRKLWCKLSLLNSHATLVLVWPGHESWENSQANSRFSTLMQLLFSFDQGMKVEKTLMQTLASQLSCNSCSRLTRTWELRKLSSKLSLLNSHATLVLVWTRLNLQSKSLCSKLVPIFHAVASYTQTRNLVASRYCHLSFFSSLTESLSDFLSLCAACCERW
jgi:hypothetical protein